MAPSFYINTLDPLLFDFFVKSPQNDSEDLFFKAWLFDLKIDHVHIWENQRIYTRILEFGDDQEFEIFVQKNFLARNFDHLSILVDLFDLWVY